MTSTVHHKCQAFVVMDVPVEFEVTIVYDARWMNTAMAEELAGCLQYATHSWFSTRRWGSRADN